MTTLDNLTGFPEGVYPDRFKDRIQALVIEIDAEMTEAERDACRQASDYQIGAYAGEVQASMPEGATISIRFQHTDLRKAQRVALRLSDLVREKGCNNGSGAGN